MCFFREELFFHILFHSLSHSLTFSRFFLVGCFCRLARFPYVDPMVEPHHVWKGKRRLAPFTALVFVCHSLMFQFPYCYDEGVRAPALSWGGSFEFAVLGLVRLSTRNVRDVTTVRKSSSVALVMFCAYLLPGFASLSRLQQLSLYLRRTLWCHVYTFMDICRFAAVWRSLYMHT